MPHRSRRPDSPLHRHPWSAPGSDPNSEQIIFIGFDPTHFIEARQADFLNTAVISSILVLLGFAGFFTLIVSQHYLRTRQRLQDTSAIAGQVVANLPAGLMVLDSQGRIVMTNPAAESITGLSARQLHGKPAETMLPRNLAELAATQPESDPVSEQEMECRFAATGPVPLSVSAASILHEQGRWIGNLIIFRNLSDIKILQQAVARSEKLAAVGGLAAGVAHEIRNPLSSVKGMATYFQNRFSHDPEARQAAEVMVAETNRLNRVISELLEFARPAGIQAGPQNLNALLDHSFRLIRQDADERSVSLEVIKQDNLPPAFIDADRFMQCLLNLYINAIQAMEPGGRLTVRSSRTKDGRIQLQVTDTGAGISENHLLRIFDPYFTTKPAGTGLGLAIVHKIIEDHQGQIHVQSMPGQGTTFTLLLPADDSFKADKADQ